jgi:hypothetical protein
MTSTTRVQAATKHYDERHADLTGRAARAGRFWTESLTPLGTAPLLPCVAALGAAASALLTWIGSTTAQAEGAAYLGIDPRFFPAEPRLVSSVLFVTLIFVPLATACALILLGPVILSRIWRVTLFLALAINALVASPGPWLAVLFVAYASLDAFTPAIDRALDRLPDRRSQRLERWSQSGAWHVARLYAIPFRGRHYRPFARMLAVGATVIVMLTVSFLAATSLGSTGRDQAASMDTFWTLPAPKGSTNLTLAFLDGDWMALRDVRVEQRDGRTVLIPVGPSRLAKDDPRAAGLVYLPHLGTVGPR